MANDDDEIRGFAMFPHSLTARADLSDAAVRAALAIVRFARDGHCTASNEQLAVACGKPLASFKRALAELIRGGIVQVELPGDRVRRAGIRLAAPPFREAGIRPKNEPCARPKNEPCAESARPKNEPCAESARPKNEPSQGPKMSLAHCRGTGASENSLEDLKTKTKTPSAPNSRPHAHAREDENGDGGDEDIDACVEWARECWPESGLAEAIPFETRAIRKAVGPRLDLFVAAMERAAISGRAVQRPMAMCLEMARGYVAAGGAPPMPTPVNGKPRPEDDFPAPRSRSRDDRVNDALAQLKAKLAMEAAP